MRAVIAIVALAIVGCTPAEKERLQAREKPAHIMCFSGGLKISDDYSIGEISHSYGVVVEYKSATDGTLRRISGDCVITMAAKMPDGFKATYPS